MKQELLIVTLFALALSKDIDLTLDVIKECVDTTCMKEFQEQGIKDNLTQSEMESNSKDIISETEDYVKCMDTESTKKDSPCYQFFTDMSKKITPEEYAACQNLCGSNYVNKYAVQMLKCACQTCADGAQCGSNILVFASLVLVGLIL